MVGLLHSFLMLFAEGGLDPAAARYLGAAMAVLVGLAAAIAMGIALSKGLEAIARQPEAEGKIRGTLLIGLAFIETTAIYGLFMGIMILIM